ncbi:restriction endonuclease [Campylobacter ureolyticus]
MASPLNDKLNSVKWGEFKIGDLFKVLSSKKIFHANKVEIYDYQVKDSLPYVVRMAGNNGIKGYIRENIKFANPKNTLTFAQDTFIISYQKFDYFTGNNVKILKPNFQYISENVLKYIAVCLQKVVSPFSWGVGSSFEFIENLKIKLPIKDENLGAMLENIDFKFMEDFIAELEAYLITTNLKDYNLTTDEKQALKDFENLEWQEFKIGDLFERISTKKLPYKARELPTEPTKNYILPCLTSSFNNQGLNYYAPKENATILKNVITIPSNSGDVYRAYFQSNDFTVLSDAYAIKCKNNIKFLNDHYLFAVMCINKVTDLPIYSYKMKLGGWNVVKNKFINLPIKNGEINYKFMQNFIKAIEKLVIKDVVDFADEKISLTKKCIKTPCETK